jgi:serine/threonine-protein kinase RsbW
LLERQNLLPCFYKEIFSNVAEINPLLDKLMDAIKNLSCGPQDQDDIRLAAYEALANAIIHGNENNPAKKVVVTCFCEFGNDDNLRLVIRDEGLGFHPDAVPDPRSPETKYLSHGRGILIIRQLMNEVSYSDGGREVQMLKRFRR